MIAPLFALPAGFAISPADSARAVAQIYAVSLLATVPVFIAAAAALALRHSAAGTRSLVWRSATAALLIVYLGHLLPVHWMAGVVPPGLASPLVSLGVLQLAVERYATPVYRVFGAPDGTSGIASANLVRALLVVYWAGVLLVTLPVVSAWAAARRMARRARPARDHRWAAMLRETRATLNVRRQVRLFISADAVVPVTWGVLRPVILLPRMATGWSDTHRRAVLLHELAHVRGADVLFSIAARIACALFWFHPAAWWVARRLRDECELASDDRVLEAGVPASDYAELLMKAADALRVAAPARPLALALAQRAGTRQRLAAIVDSRRDIRAPARATVAFAAAVTIAIAGPMSAVRLAPSRDVLTTLMQDSRWESRAFAVIGLAQRPDSVDVARAAAELDPSPRVRAWAKFALGRERASERLSPLLHEPEPPLGPDRR